MQLHFLGATGTVTGSRYLLRTTSRQLLVDCGLFQGYKQLRLRNWSAPPFDPRAIDAVVLTHAHIDHSGYLPALVRRGFRGPIYCSAGTLELCKILLPDSAHLQEEEARYANCHGFSKHKPALPLYTLEHAEACLEQFRPIEFERRQKVADTFTFTGDLGRPNDPLMNALSGPAHTDYLITESTYGDRTHPVIDPQVELAGWLAKAVARGDTVVMPTFAIGRTQALLLHIARLKEKRALADVPVFIDSPMAVDATALYRQFRHEHRVSEVECERMCRAAQIVTTPEQSKALDRLAGPAIILSASSCGARRRFGFMVRNSR